MKNTACHLPWINQACKPGSVILKNEFLSVTVICLDYTLPYSSCHPREYAGQTPRFRVPQTVLLRIGFTFAQSRQCAGELLPRLSTLALTGGLFLLHFP